MFDRKLSKKAEKIRTQLTNKALFHSYLMVKMPLLAMTGTRVEVLNLDECETILPFGWRTRNIFNTMYFGAILMAAESACGSLVLLHERNLPERYSPIVKSVEADFIKAATSDIIFRCEQGDIAAQLLQRTKNSGKREEAMIEVVGRTKNDGEVARVRVLWSVRMKK